MHRFWIQWRGLEEPELCYYKCTNPFLHWSGKSIIQSIIFALSAGDKPHVISYIIMAKGYADRRWAYSIYMQQIESFGFVVRLHHQPVKCWIFSCCYSAFDALRWLPSPPGSVIILYGSIGGPGGCQMLLWTHHLKAGPPVEADKWGKTSSKWPSAESRLMIRPSDL